MSGAPDRRAVVLALREQGLTYAQIARELGCSPKTARSYALGSRPWEPRRRRMAEARRMRAGPERTALVRALLEQGLSRAAIAGRLGLSIGQVTYEPQARCNRCGKGLRITALYAGPCFACATGRPLTLPAAVQERAAALVW